MAMTSPADVAEASPAPEPTSSSRETQRLEGEKHCEDAGGANVVIQYDLSRRKKLYIFLVLSLVALVQAFDATCVCVTLPTLAVELNATVSESLGLGMTFLLATTLSQPIFTEISHVVGRKPAYIAALTIFIAGSIVCGCAGTATLLLIGRTIQGVGAGGTQPLSAVILTDLFPLRERARWVSFLNISWALGTIAGPLLGGVFSQNEAIGWRWIFWINLPFLAISTIGVSCLLGYDKPAKMSRRLIGRVDWGGMALFVTSAGAILTPLTWGGSRYPWTSQHVIMPLIFGLLGFVLLGCYEAQLAKKPMFRPSLFSDYSTVFQFVSTAIHGSLMWMVLYYMSLYYLAIKRMTPLMTGVWALPATLTVAPMALVIGLVVSKTGHYRGFLLGGWLLTTIQLGILCHINENTVPGELIVVSVLIGVAMGALVPSMSVAVQSTVARADAGHAIAMVYMLRSAGQCLGIAIGLSVFSTRLRDLLEGTGSGKDAAEDFVKNIRNSSPSADVRVGVVVQALRTVWLTGCVLAAGASVLTCCTRCPRLPEDRLRQGVDEEAVIAAPPGGGEEMSRA